MRRFKELDMVQLRQPWLEQGLPDRMRGTVVMVYNDPQGYEVEFLGGDGQPLALVSLSEEESMERLAPDFETVKNHVFDRHAEVFRRLSKK